MKTLIKLLPFVAVIALTMLGCKKEPAVGDPKLNIPEHQRSITISREAQTVTIDVESNRIWEIRTFSDSDGWYRITPVSLEGEGNGRITVTVNSNPAPALQRELELIIGTIGGISRQVIITQEGEEPIPTTLIYADNFGTGGPTSGAGLSITEFQGFNREGTSAASVYYTSEGGTVDLRSGQPSTGYRNASGGNNVFFATAGGASFIINGIIPDDYQNFFLSFGTNQNHDTISVEFSTDDGATWTPTSFDKPETGWGLVEIAFTIPAGVDSIKLKFTAGRTQFGARIDDVRLEGVDGEVQPGAALSISPSSLNIPTAGDSRDISITSNTNWTATSNADWVSVSTPSGNGNYTLSVVVLENTGAARQTTVTIATTDGTISRTLNISQDGLFLSVSPETLSFFRDADENTFNITSNVSWTITSSETWATPTPANGSNNETITVAVTENTTDASRSATLTISADGLPDQTVTIEQSSAAAPANLVINGSFENWTGVLPANWLRDQGTNQNSIITRITENVQHGNYALRIRGDGNTGQISQIVEGIEAGATYTVSFWYRSNTRGSAVQGMRIWSQFRTATANISIDDHRQEDRTKLQPSTFEPTSEWTLYTIDVVAPAGATAFNFVIRATNGHEGIIDNLTIVRKP